MKNTHNRPAHIGDIMPKVMRQLEAMANRLQTTMDTLDPDVAPDNRIGGAMLDLVCEIHHFNNKIKKTLDNK